MVVTKLNFSSIGLKGLGGLAVERMRGWIGDAIIMVLGLVRALVTFAGWERRYPTASIKRNLHLGMALTFEEGLIHGPSILA
jgi:hypothetical protein